LQGNNEWVQFQKHKDHLSQFWSCWLLMPNGLTLQVSRYVLHERACECSRGAQDPSSSSWCVHFF
jgi:hypothetical protein